MAQKTTKFIPLEIRGRLDGCFPALPVTIKKGYNLKIGTVLGRITASGLYGPYDNTAADGREVASGILAQPVNASATATLNTAGLSPLPLDRDEQAAMYYGGIFKESVLTGLDAAGKTDLGARSIPGNDLVIIPT